MARKYWGLVLVWLLLSCGQQENTPAAAPTDNPAEPTRPSSERQERLPTEQPQQAIPSTLPEPDPLEGVPSIALYYKDNMVDSGFPQRVLISEQYMRLDDVESVVEEETERSFSLFSRGDNTLFNVNHEEQSIVVLRDAGEELAMPRELRMQLLAETAGEGQVLYAGKRVKAWQLHVNERQCMRFYSFVSPFLTKAKNALLEYEKLLAKISAKNLERVPHITQTPCFLARNIYALEWIYKAGFPAMVEYEDGGQQELRSYDLQYRANPNLFVLPESYTRLSFYDLYPPANSTEESNLQP